MKNKKATSRLTQAEVQKRAAELNEQRNRRWQKIAFAAFSVIILLSMVISLFVQP